MRIDRVHAIACGAIAFALTAPAEAQDPPPDDSPDWLFGHARLSRPDPAVDEDASGFAFLLEHGERMALHIHVFKLDPGATYDVRATLGDETESIGMITTRGDDPPPTPRFYFAVLSGSREVPPVETDARGFGSFILNRELTQLTYRVVAWRLSGPLTAAHIHTGVVGEDGDVLLPLDAETLEGTLDVTAEQVALLAAEGLYVNLHTELNPDGEIRGQIKPLRIFDHFLRRRAGSGALRLDTNREDAFPFDVASIAGLEGVRLSIVNAEDEVVLAGTVEDIIGLGHDGDDGEENGEGGAGGLPEDAIPPPPPTGTDLYFAMSDEHDASFTRGDANEDGQFDLSDPINVLFYLFLGTPPAYCLDSADADDDGLIEISDPIHMLRSLFQSGDPLAPPYPLKGFDATPDRLFCGEDSGA